jgi:teichuronic acid biosynthesis glycosyltransferase TuaC
MRMKISWIHNYADRAVGMFMWDIFDVLNGDDEYHIEHFALPVIRKRKDLYEAVRRFRNIPRSANLLHAQYGSIVGFLTAFKGKRYIITLRGTDVYPLPGGLRARFFGKLRIAMSCFAARRAQAVIVMSNAMRQKVERWMPNQIGKIHTVVDPAGRDFWPQNSDNISSDLASYSLKIAAGSLNIDNPIKRLSIISEAVRLCTDIGLNVTLTQVSGDSRLAFRAAILESDVIALSSIHEGWPNVIKEGLLLGKDFIATDVSDLKEYSANYPYSIISHPTAVDFALSIVDHITKKVLSSRDTPHNLSAFHPDSCSLKLKIIYRAYGLTQ